MKHSAAKWIKREKIKKQTTENPTQNILKDWTFVDIDSTESAFRNGRVDQT